MAEAPPSLASDVVSASEFRFESEPDLPGGHNLAGQALDPARSTDGIYGFYGGVGKDR